MQNKKRKVLAVSLIVCLIAILSVGSLAWFTASDEVTNTIKLADDFSVDVYETDENGDRIKSGDETPGQIYTGVMPGQKLHKDPTVWNTGNHDEYIRVFVTLSNYSVWAEALEDGTNLATIFDGFDPNAWTRYDAPEVNSDDDTVTYTFYLTKYRDSNVLPPNDAAALFTDVTIPGELTSEQADTMDSLFTIKVKAEAIQVENLPDDVTDAYGAFALLED